MKEQLDKESKEALMLDEFYPQAEFFVESVERLIKEED